MNTPPGAPLVRLYDPQNNLRASVEYTNTTNTGNTFLTPVSPSPPAGWNVGSTPQYWDISTNVSFSGSVHVFLYYNPGNIPGPENTLRLLHFENGTWVDITDTADLAGNRIGGTVTSLSPFVLAARPGATGVGDEPTPTTFALRPNIPNPFNPVTTIEYDVPHAALVTIDVLSVAGARVRTLVKERRAPGRYDVQWDGEDDRGARAASGVYFYRMSAGSFVKTRKMVLLK
jgi:hypothetical protein